MGITWWNRLELLVQGLFLVAPILVIALLPGVVRAAWKGRLKVDPDIVIELDTELADKQTARSDDRCAL